MKATRQSLGRSLDQPDPAIRCFLFHGPDDAQSRGHGERLVKALGASRFILPAATVKSDPATLPDEAGAMNLFGGTRVIWVEPAGDEVVAGVEALLEAPAPEGPVVLIAGTLRKTSALLKLAETSREILSHASYQPEGQDAERMATELARTVGLRIERSVASRLCEACSNDRAILLQEVTKLALYLDASPEAPKTLDQDALEAVGAALPEGDFLRLADIALRGDVRLLAEELSNMTGGTNDAVPIIRAMQRRIAMLAPLRSRIEAGASLDAAMTSAGKALFWKDKPAVGAMLARWTSGSLAMAADRIGRLERQMMFSAAPQSEALGEELLAVARAAARGA